MAIVKTIKRDNPFALIEKKSIEDSRLSWAATGLLAYLVSRPENWTIVMEHLKTVKTTGRDATRSALNELRQFGYCHYFEIRKSGRIVENFYVVFETPTPYQTALCSFELNEGETIIYKEIKSNEKKVSTANGFSVNGSTVNGKPATNNIDINNIDINKKDHEHEELDVDLDVFEKLFKEKYKINFTATNQAAIKKLLAKQTQEQVICYLDELYQSIASTPGVKSITGLFCSKLKKGERQITKADREKIKAKEQESKSVPAAEEVRKKIRERCNYYLDLYSFTRDQDDSIRKYLNDVEIYKDKYSELVLEYEAKLKKALGRI